MQKTRFVRRFVERLSIEMLSSFIAAVTHKDEVLF
jgi:hypothetical protein